MTRYVLFTSVVRYMFFVMRISSLLERDPNPYPRAPTGLAVHFQLSTESMSALAHLRYSRSLLGRTRIEALPVIGYLCPISVLSDPQCYPDTPSLRVATGVDQRLFEDVQQL